MNISKNNILYALFAVYFFYSLYQITTLSKQATENELASKSAKITNIEPISNDAPKGYQTFLSILDNIKGDITNELKDHSQSASTVIWASMIYTYSNSLHKIDEGHNKYASNLPYVLKRLHEANSGDIKEKPHLSCGPRAYAMAAILTRFNIYSRPIRVFSDNYNQLEGHRLLEVYNPEEQSWEVWDPDFGVTYVDIKTNKPVDVLTLIFSDKNNIIPVGLSAKGWKETKTEHLKNNYFESVLFEADEGPINSMIVINESLFNIDNDFSSGFKFKDWARKNYRNPRIVLFSNEDIVTRPN